MTRTEVTIGIDIGGTYTKFGLVDRAGNCLAEGVMPTNSSEEIKMYLNRLYSNIEQLTAEISSSIEIKGIGIGVPNGNYYKGTIEHAANLGWKGIVPLADYVKEHYNLPVSLTNDANAAALGEMKFGVAKDMRNFVMITLGTGLGSGIVVNGDLVYGADGFAGEIGHTCVKPNGRVCGCGRRGCLETYASVTGIRRTVYKLLADLTDDSILRDVKFNDLTGVMITQAALQGDPIGVAAFEYTGNFLGKQLADTVAHLSPEAFVFFGGLTKAGKYLLEPTKRHLEANLLSIYKDKVKLLVSGMEGKSAAILGASALIWNELEKKREI